MKNILLACSAGMSTSLLVTKMEEAAEKQDINVNIKAMSSDNAFHSLEDYDVLLIGPQMRFMRKKFLKAAEDKGLNLPIEAIDSVSYGRIAFLSSDSPSSLFEGASVLPPNAPPP